MRTGWRLEPEHVEKLMQKMQRAGSAPATAHQAYRTLRTALNEAVRRKHITENPVLIAKPPKLVEEEVEPYTVQEVQRLLVAAARRRNSARWALALALGLRQSEVLGRKWVDVDLDQGVLRVRRGRLRPKYAHGCRVPCGRKAGYCRDRVAVHPDTRDTKSRAGRRPIGLPDELVAILRRHRDVQAAERALAASLWQEAGWVFTNEIGRPLNPNTDYHQWKALVQAAGVRDARLHDARHTAATALLLLGVPDRIVMGIMGWSSDMRRRYQHVTDPMLRDTADKVGRLLWEVPTAAERPAGAE